MNTLGWTAYQQMIEKDSKKLFKAVDRLIALKETGKQNTNKYQALRTRAELLCETIGDKFDDFADYYGI